VIGAHEPSIPARSDRGGVQPGEDPLVRPSAPARSVRGRRDTPARRGRRALAVWPLLALLVLALPLGGCAPALVGAQRYTPADAGVDPYAKLRQKAEELYQAGQAQERAGDWRKALRSYEQARLWDPDNRQDILDGMAHAREEVAALAYAAPPPTATFQAPASRGGAAGPSPTAPGARPGTTPPAQPAPTPTPGAAGDARAQAGYRTYHSKIYPYTIAYPVDWRAQGDAAQAGGVHEDVFSAPQSKTAEASVIVMAIAVPREITLDRFYAAVAGELEDQPGFRELAPRSVDGVQAYAVAHRLSIGGKDYPVTEVIFVKNGFGWMLLLAAAPDLSAPVLQTFDAMLESFRSEPSPSQVQ